MRAVYQLDELAALANAEADAIAGRKASTLARLRAAGLPVADGIVCVGPAPLPRDLVRMAARLGARTVVRSSSAGEDGERSAAPGVFESVAFVAPDELERAVRTVQASAHSDRARAYARATGTAFPLPMAVLIQPHLAASASGTLYSRLEEGSEEMIAELEHDGKRARLVFDRDPSAPSPALLPELDELRRIALVIEHRVGASAGVDIEWRVSGGALWIAQARPIGRYPRKIRPQPSVDVFGFARAVPTATWRLDIEHNPLPLSAAQRGLVDLCVRELAAPLALACGYLYERALERGEVAAASVAELEAIFFADVAPALEARLDASESAEPDLERALTDYVEVNRRYREDLAPTLAGARRQAQRASSLGIGARLLAEVADKAAGFTAAARAYAAPRSARGNRWFFAPYASKWDVIEPVYDEDRSALAELAATLDAAPIRTGSPGTPLERAIYAVSELDDRLFYRAQWLVRRAVLALAGGEPDGELRFELELPTLREWSRVGAPPAGAASEAKANRQRRLEAHDLCMPLEVKGDAQSSELAADSRSAVLFGVGSGGVASGRVCKGTMIGRGVFVAVDLTPGDVMRVANAAAIILEGGDLLGHASALARELGIPIVTNVESAAEILADADPVWVDADAGVVVRV